MSIGLSMDNILAMDIGILLDLITTKSNMYIKEKEKQESSTSKKKNSKWRWATQSDFDRLR